MIQLSQTNLSFFPSEHSDYNELINQSTLGRPSSLEIKVVRDAIIFPTGYFGNYSFVSQCGAYDASGNLIKESIIRRGNAELCALPARLNLEEHVIEDEIEEAIYGGFMTSHFGHFLLETTARLWAIVNRLADVDVVFCGSRSTAPLFPEILSHYQPNYSGRIILPDKPLRIRSLDIPTPTSSIRQYVMPRHCAEVRTNRLKTHTLIRPGKIIYLSRSKLSRNTRYLINENMVEDYIASLGGRIIHPQELTLSQQLEEIESSELIISPTGSASHILLLATGHRNVIHLCGNRVNTNYGMIDSILPNDVTYVSCISEGATDSPNTKRVFSCNIDVISAALNSTKDQHTFTHNRLSFMSRVFKLPTDSQLDQLGIQYNTDKSSVNRKRPNESKSRGFGHNYLVKYELFLEKYQAGDIICMLELGAGPDWNIGASAKVWREYYRDIDLHVADIKQTALSIQDDSTTVHVGDLGELQFLNKLAEVGPFDVILDDASHQWSHQISCFLQLFSTLKKGGVYIIEDILTSFGPMRERYHGESSHDAFQFLTYLSGLVAGKGRRHPLLEAQLIDQKFSTELLEIYKEIDMISFINHSSIIVKSM